MWPGPRSSSSWCWWRCNSRSSTPCAWAAPILTSCCFCPWPRGMRRGPSHGRGVRVRRRSCRRPVPAHPVRSVRPGGMPVGVWHRRRHRGLVRSSWWLPSVVAVVATAAGSGAYAYLGAVLGDQGMLKTYLAPALVVETPVGGPVCRARVALRGVGSARARSEPQGAGRRGAEVKFLAAALRAEVAHADTPGARRASPVGGSRIPPSVCAAPTSIPSPKHPAPALSRRPEPPWAADAPRRSVVDRVMAVSEPSRLAPSSGCGCSGSSSRRCSRSCSSACGTCRSSTLRVLPDGHRQSGARRRGPRARGLITDRTGNIMVGDEVTQRHHVVEGVGPATPGGGRAARRASRDPLRPDRGRPRQRPVQPV